MIGGSRAERPRQPQQSPQHVVEVGAEERRDRRAARRARSSAELARKRLPVPRVGEDAEVEHVGVGDQNPRRSAADRRALRRRRVAVVDRAGQPSASRPAACASVSELAALILAQRLEREEEERPPGSAGERLLQHRQLKDQRLARGGGSGDQDVAAARDAASAATWCDQSRSIPWAASARGELRRRAAARIGEAAPAPGRAALVRRGGLPSRSRRAAQRGFERSVGARDRRGTSELGDRRRRFAAAPGGGSPRTRRGAAPAAARRLAA